MVTCTMHAHKSAPQQSGSSQKGANKRTTSSARAPVLSYYITNAFQRPFGSDRYNSFCLRMFSQFSWSCALCLSFMHLHTLAGIFCIRTCRPCVPPRKVPDSRAVCVRGVQALTMGCAEGGLPPCRGPHTRYYLVYCVHVILYKGLSSSLLTDCALLVHKSNKLSMVFHLL